MLLIGYAATKVRSVDKNCPPIKFVGQHGVSYLGHKRPKMLKNSEWQACRVDTILGQCGKLFSRDKDCGLIDPIADICCYAGI